MKKYLFIIIVTALVLLFLTACGTQTPGNNPNPPQDAPGDAPQDTPQDDAPDWEKVVIAMTINVMDPFVSLLVDGARDFAAKHPDIELIIVDANQDVSVQLRQAEDFANQRVDALIVKPVDPAATAAISDRFADENIPLLCVEQALHSDFHTFVGSDNVKGGTLQAEYVIELLGGQGKVAIIVGNPRESGAIGRTEGVETTVLRFPDIEIVSTQTANWSRDEAMRITEAWIQSGIEIDAILSNNDEMALGAVMAFEQANRELILIAGVDALPEALQALKDGRMTATVFQNAYGMGYQVVESAYKIINGETVEHIIDIPFELVTPALADEFLARYE